MGCCVASFLLFAVIVVVVVASFLLFVVVFVVVYHILTRGGPVLSFSNITLLRRVCCRRSVYLGGGMHVGDKCMEFVADR